MRAFAAQHDERDSAQIGGQSCKSQRLTLAAILQEANAPVQRRRAVPSAATGCYVAICALLE